MRQRTKGPPADSKPSGLGSIYPITRRHGRTCPVRIARAVTSAILSSRRWLIWLLRVVALLVVCLAVHSTVRHALAQLSERDWHLSPAWIVASGALYVLGLMPMGWFWGRTLAAMRFPAPLMAVLRAYFLGHLGKYVPGKAMTVILRVAAVRRWVPSMRIALVSVLLETLTMMAVGATLAFVISVAVLRSDVTISLIALGMAVAAGLPTAPPVLQWLARFGADRIEQEDKAKPRAMNSAEFEMNFRGINFRLLAEGWVAAVICWLFLGASLWSTLRAIGVDQLGLFANLPSMVTAAAFAVVAGFLSMLPSGLIVRDAALMQLLAPVCGDANALVAAVLMRLVWLVSEIVVYGILYVGGIRGQGTRDRE